MKALLVKPPADMHVVLPPIGTENMSFDQFRELTVMVKKYIFSR